MDRIRQVLGKGRNLIFVPSSEAVFTTGNRLRERFSRQAEDQPEPLALPAADERPLELEIGTAVLPSLIKPEILES